MVMPYYTNMSTFNHQRAALPVYVRGLYSGKYTLRQAAESTGYSIPYLCNLKKSYSLYGDSVFLNKNTGRIPHNKIDGGLRSRVAAIYAANYSDVNFSYFTLCLKEFEGIDLSYKTVAAILSEYGMVSPESHKVKVKKTVHRPRLRRDCEGDLLQIDGTPFAWFYKFGDNNRYCLTGSIDDATGKITGLYLTKNECIYGYLEILRQTASRFGLPREIYSDRAAIFCHTPKGAKLSQWEKLEVMHEKRTQWQRILEELNINQILAWSPEAKGRVERMWRTIQGQLPVWLYKRGASNMDEANAILSEYIKVFNSRYGVEPAVDDPFWIDAPENLEEILCTQFHRRADKNACIAFQGSLLYSPETDSFAYRDVTVCINVSGIYAKYQGRYYPLLPVGEKVQEVIGDKLPGVVAEIIHRYLFAYAKEVSA